MEKRYKRALEVLGKTSVSWIVVAIAWHFGFEAICIGFLAGIMTGWKIEWNHYMEDKKLAANPSTEA